MLLVGSRRCGWCSCRRVGLACLPLSAALSSHEATPQHREALPYLCDWEYGAGGREKKRKPAEMPNVPEPQQDEEKRIKGEKVRMSPTLLCTPYYALVDRRSLEISTLLPSSHQPPRATLYPNPGGGGN